MVRTRDFWLAALLALAPATDVWGGVLAGRGGVTLGSFDFSNSDRIKTSSVTYGWVIGATAAAGQFYADAAAEYQGVPDALFLADRTDVLLTAGIFLDERWSLYTGYRYGRFGEGVGSNDSYNESGPYFGLSFARPLDSGLMLGVSSALNFVELQTGSGAYLADAGGVSLKVQTNFPRTPHSAVFRGQWFKGESHDPSNTFDYRESFISLGYQYSFDITSW